MGYYVEITEAHAVIPKENLDEAYRRLCDLNKQDDLKAGGSWQGGRQIGRWFRWMPSDYDETCSDTADILETVGFDFENSDKGLEITHYDSKTGDEGLFIATIADLFLEESYIDWRGEDGEIWRWVFGGGEQMQISSASVVWNDPVPYTI